MKLTKEQQYFLKKAISGNWVLNPGDEVDVDGSVYITKVWFLDWFKKYGKVEIPIQFGRVDGKFYIENGVELKTLKGMPRSCRDLHIRSLNLKTLDYLPENIDENINLLGNDLTDYFKSIKEEDFKFWDKILDSYTFLSEYPFLINILKKYIGKDRLMGVIQSYPQIKIYLE